MEYFEDVSAGDTDSFGTYEVTAEEIVDFAERYDPQQIHVDEEAAADSLFGGLIASGWHTAAMSMRLIVDNLLDGVAARGAVGVDDLRWRRPVRPGDSLSVEVEIRDTEDWDGDNGLVHVAITTLADDEVVMSMVAQVLFARRPDDE